MKWVINTKNAKRSIEIKRPLFISVIRIANLIAFMGYLTAIFVDSTFYDKEPALSDCFFGLAAGLIAFTFDAEKKVTVDEKNVSLREENEDCSHCQ